MIEIRETTVVEVGLDEAMASVSRVLRQGSKSQGDQVKVVASVEITESGNRDEATYDVEKRSS